MTGTENDDRPSEPRTRRDLLRLGTMTFLTAALARASLGAAVQSAGGCGAPITTWTVQADAACVAGAAAGDADCGLGAPAGGAHQDNDCTTQVTDDDCALQSGTTSTVHEDNDCTPAIPESDQDCGEQGPEGSYVDNDCSVFGTDQDCGRLRDGGNPHSDSDCGPTSHDNDCGLQLQDLRTAPDEDCYTGGPVGMWDNDCGGLSSASGHRHQDQDCCVGASVGLPSTDNRCGLYRPTGAQYQDTCCGTPTTGYPGAVMEDHDCGGIQSTGNDPTTHSDLDCGLPSGTGVPFSDGLID